MTTTSNIRYFHTESLAADWMEKFHDVVCEYDGEGKYYVQDSSLQIFCPIIGDLIWVEWPNIADNIKHTHKCCYLWGGSKLMAEIETVKIIQRNGVAFMWPESESI